MNRSGALCSGMERSMISSHNDLEVWAVVDGVDTSKVVYSPKEREVAAQNIDEKLLSMVDVLTDSDEDIIRHMIYHQKYGYARAKHLVGFAVEHPMKKVKR